MNTSAANQFKRRVMNWLMSHLQAMVFSLGQLWRRPLSSLLTAAVIGIALTLPTGFYVLLQNAEQLIQDWDGTIEISAFLVKTEQSQAPEELIKQLSEADIVSRVEYLSEQQALAEYKSLSGFSDALDILQENPLPALLLIDLNIDQDDNAAVETFVTQLEQEPLIENVVLDRQWLSRLQQIVHTLRRGVYIITALLAIAVLLIIGNTIRLNINTKRQEIEIIKLFGGTNDFIQRPFLYSGFWYGVVGSIIAIGLVGLSMWLLLPSIKQLIALYASSFQLQFLGFKQGLALAALGAGLGLIGSWISVEQHIRRIEPQ